MSRNKDYQRLLNSKRWRELRMWKLEHNPLCEMCQRAGYVRAAVDIHHIRPVESARSIEEMERLCFNPSNLMALCIPCHVAIHKDMGKGSKSNHQERVQQQLERWKERHEGKADRTRANMRGTKPTNHQTSYIHLRDAIDNAAFDMVSFMQERLRLIRRQNHGPQGEG